MDYSLAVGCFQAPADLLKNVDCLGHGQFPALDQQAFQVPAFDVVHGDELAPVGHPEIEDPDNVLVRDLARQNQLLLETPQYLRISGQVGANHLQGHEPVEFAISSFINGAHAALAQAIENLVALAQYVARLWLVGRQALSTLLNRNGPASCACCRVQSFG